MEILKDSLENVVQLMVEDAVDLYINAFINVLRIENGERKLKYPDIVKSEYLDTMTEVTLFFCSDYGELLTGLNGKVVMETLNKRAEEAYKDERQIEKCKRTRVAFRKPYYRGERLCIKK